MVLGKSDEGGYYKTYGSDAEGEKGYLKATFSKGNHGYKNLDTFHKQDGDKYAFEKHIAYGKARADKKSGHNVAASSRSGKGGDYEGAGTMKLAQLESRNYNTGNVGDSCLVRELVNTNFSFPNEISFIKDVRLYSEIDGVN